MACRVPQACRSRLEQLTPRSRRERGAIFVEAIIVITSFTLLFLGLVFFRDFYRKEMFLARLARASTLAYSMGGCQDNDPASWAKADLGKSTNVKPGRTNDSQPTDSRPVTGSDKAKDIVNSLPGTGSDNSILNPVGSVALSSQVSDQTRQGLFSGTFGFTKPAHSTSFVSCGDKVRDGDFGEIVSVVTSRF
jgi:hypothetical protein